MQSLTIIIPSHARLTGIEATIKKLLDHPKSEQIHEILICHNGPVPNGFDLTKNYGPKTRLLHIDKPGLGSGLKLGIEHTQSEYLLMTATDLPFEFTDLDQWLALPEPKPEIVIGSKGHRDSQVGSHGPVRLIMSNGYRLLRWMAFPFKYPLDPQGTLFLKTAAVKKTNYQSFSDTFFCTTELIAHMLMNQASWLEVPIVLQPRDGKSSVKIFRDSWDMLKRTIQLGILIRRSNGKHHPSLSNR
tara:strand:- start:87263 stop:87994 length:732 start_codon:yes stop_codon:yes gene_type:complete